MSEELLASCPVDGYSLSLVSRLYDQEGDDAWAMSLPKEYLVVLTAPSVAERLLVRTTDKELSRLLYVAAFSKLTLTAT